MFFSNIQAERQPKTMPQVSHKNEVIGRGKLNQWIHYGFTIAELSLIILVFIGLYVIRLSQEFGYVGFNTFLTNLPRFEEYGVFLMVSIVSYMYWLYHYRLLQPRNYITTSFMDEISKVFRSISYAILTSIGVAFLFKILIYSRLVVVMFWSFGFVSAFTIRTVKRAVVVNLAQKGILTRNVVVVGAGKVGELLAKEFKTRPGLGYRIVGFIDDHKQGLLLNEHQIIGKTNDLHRLIKFYPIDEVIITIPSERDIVDKIIKEFRKYNLTIRIIPEMYNLVSKTIEVGRIDALPYVTLVKTPMRGFNLYMKRFVEWGFSLLGVLIITPVLFLLVLAIKLDSKGPIFYKQRRVGKDGKYFYMYKFRSMVANADKVLTDLLEKNEVDGPAFKMKNDPRITRVGKFIRKYSLDELPQLFNVLKGEMSLIGPRPPLPNEVTEYGDWEWRRLEVLPGITGLWQVSGRSDLSFQQWVNLDIYYIENWSFTLDLKILLKTIPAVLKGEGAY